MACSLGLDLSQKGLALYTIPAALFLALVPSGYALSLARSNADIHEPRKLLQRVEKDETLDKRIKSRIIRAKGASENAIETLGYHAVAVAAAVFSGVDPCVVNGLSLGYLVARVLFAYTYVVLQDNRRFAPLRSLFWFVAQGITFTLYFKAARALSV
ncbi:hypothetical protein SODALDRAFT_333129 [Sodiomyces alkalinus F11]|uniref:Uncharacterized protein n=1 Tax=Sodiomyces alkalinus (strain CBS 110278 / VKM F-3762 / F11) TaxID=1314773 RepID=A0A3N2PVM4_SODAK|nr:hypothetical protein SODALDRAFT_333129 [Sodiomyces alkalinus F11]ROT38534.1 hypothetical protein SODALDRAFT_333129 [Sodiomyces alkalinus F11]